MERHYNSRIFLYINGELSPRDVHFLESQDSFMKDVIRLTKNKEYYFLSSDRLKKDEDFALELVEIFKDDHEFLREMGETFIEKNNYKSDNIIDLTIKLSDLYEETNDDELYDFYVRGEDFYRSIMEDVLHEIMATKDEYDRKELGQGFNLIDMTFNHDPIIREFVAKKMTEEILLNHPSYEFEELVHYTGINTTALRGREREFIFRYITKEDKTLGDYLAIHPRLTDKYIPLLKDVLEHWDTYLEVLNQDKIDQVDEEMNRYIEENNLDKRVKTLYRGIVDLTNSRDKIYKYSNFEGNDYRKVDYKTISVQEMGFVKHMKTYIDDVFDIDVPYVDMINVSEYNDDNKEIEGSKILSLGKYLKNKE